MVGKPCVVAVRRGNAVPPLPHVGEHHLPLSRLPNIEQTSSYSDYTPPYKLSKKIESDDDTELSIDSPDSGFHSATPSGGASSPSEFFDDSSKGTSICTEELPTITQDDCQVYDDHRLCLMPPPKPTVIPEAKPGKSLQSRLRSILDTQKEFRLG